MTIATKKPYVSFMSRVEERDDGCWIWTGPLDRKGYGRCSFGLAHRWAYRLFTGPIPAGLMLDHLCRTHACVCPRHLEPVTNQENLRRHFALQTHCKHGHEYTPENTYVAPQGYRKCRRCHVIENVARQRTEHVRAQRREWYRASKASA